MAEPEISRTIAHNVARYRRERDLSLAELAELSGLGKSTLSVLESGHANPSVETLWAVVTALGVPFGALLDEPAESLTVVRAGQGQLVEEAGHGFGAWLLRRSPDAGVSEVYRIELAAGGRREAEPHLPGTSETVFSVKGILETGPVQEPLQLKPGDLVSFAADVPHCYHAPAGPATALVLLHYGPTRS